MISVIDKKLVPKRACAHVYMPSFGSISTSPIYLITYKTLLLFFFLPIVAIKKKKKRHKNILFFFILFYIFSFQNTLYHIIYFTLYFIKITNFIDFLKLFFLIYIYNIYNNRWSREKIQLDFNWILNFAPFVLTKTQKKNLIRL